MQNFLLAFYGNRQGRFFLLVYTDSWDSAETLGRAAAGEMGYGFTFEGVQQDMSNVC